MLPPLTKKQDAWARKTLDEMTLDECIASLLAPVECTKKPEEWLKLLDSQPVETIFCGFANYYQSEYTCDLLQEHSRHPVMVCVDLENGLGQQQIPNRTEFPWAMAYGAGATKTHAKKTGQALAAEIRERGFHWTFAPVCDLPLHPRESEVGQRAVSDDPDKVIDILVPRIQGLQEKGRLLATAKHFPGLGCDDRDQHVTTALMPLSLKDWMATYGKIYKALFAAGVGSVMIGHIAMPDYEGKAARPFDALPATLSRKLMTNLLRKELGFEGLIVSDAACMCGLTTRVPSDRAAVEFLKAGGDVWLFANMDGDPKAIRKALKKKELSEKRLWDAGRRVVEAKARLNLFEDPKGPTITDKQIQAHAELAQEVADRSLVIKRNDKSLPLKLKKGAKVLTVTLRYDKRADRGDSMPLIDQLLRERGFDVTHKDNIGGKELWGSLVHQFDHVFINYIHLQHTLLGTMQLTGPFVNVNWEHGHAEAPEKATFTVFGNPKMDCEHANIPNLLLAWSPAECMQRAAVKCWLGEIGAKGKMPIRLPSPKEYMAQMRQALPI